MSHATPALSVRDASSDSEEIRLRLHKDLISQQIDEFIEVVSSEAFIDYVNGIASLPTHEERRTRTAETATLDTLAERGVPITPGLRITTREFEAPADGRTAATPLVQVRPDLDPRMGFCVSLGFYLCASYGG